MKALNYEVNIAKLSPQLQVLINLELRQTELEQRMNSRPVQMQMSFDDSPTPSPVTVYTQTATAEPEVLPVTFLSPGDWRRDTNAVISAIARKTKDYSSVRARIYRELEARTRCRLSIRLENLRKNMIYNGATSAQAGQKNYLDVIEKDPKLISAYIPIVRELAAAYGIKFHKRDYEGVNVT